MYFKITKIIIWINSLLNGKTWVSIFCDPPCTLFLFHILSALFVIYVSPSNPNPNNIYTWLPITHAIILYRVSRYRFSCSIWLYNNIVLRGCAVRQTSARFLTARWTWHVDFHQTSKANIAGLYNECDECGFESGVYYYVLYSDIIIK